MHRAASLPFDVHRYVRNIDPLTTTDIIDRSVPSSCKNIRVACARDALWHMLTHSAVHHLHRRGHIRDVLMISHLLAACTAQELAEISTLVRHHPLHTSLRNTFLLAHSLSHDRDQVPDPFAREAAIKYWHNQTSIQRRLGRMLPGRGWQSLIYISPGPDDAETRRYKHAAYLALYAKPTSRRILSRLPPSMSGFVRRVHLHLGEFLARCIALHLAGVPRMTLLAPLAAAAVPFYLGTGRWRALLEQNETPDVTSHTNFFGTARHSVAADRIVRALGRIPLSPWRSTCLYRAIAQCLLFRWTGTAAVLRVGVSAGTHAEDTRAHAWVEGMDGALLYERRGEFVPLT
jgi:hypothetical protein